MARIYFVRMQNLGDKCAITGDIAYLRRVVGPQTKPLTRQFYGGKIARVSL